MQQVDEVEALRWAKRNCERDGWNWDASVLMIAKPGLVPNKPGLDRTARARNLARARTKLLKEQAKHDVKSQKRSADRKR